VETLRRLTGGIGPDRVIDCVGVDAQSPDQHAGGDTWVPGDAPAQALQWAVQAAAKAGTLSIVGVYPPEMESFPIGMAMNKNLTLKMGNCNHRRYIPELIELVRIGALDPSRVITQIEPATSAVEAYERFDRREPGWLKVELDPTEV